MRKLKDGSTLLSMKQVPRTEESARHWARQAAPLQNGRDDYNKKERPEGRSSSQ
jgi:hypothetical protein